MRGGFPMANNVPSLVTQQMIYEEILSLKKEIRQLNQRDIETSIEEYSLNKAAKLLRIGQATLMSYVMDGKLKARIVKNNKSRTGYSYKFALREIYRFQNSEQFTPTDEKTAEPFNAKQIINQFHNSRKVVTNG